MLYFFNKQFTPVQMLSLGYVLIIFAGAFLLMLPASSANNTSQFFVDALFTSASAVSTTGLVVVDTGTYYSSFGQWIILILIQIGGIGYMAIFVIFAIIFKNKLSVSGKKYLRESISRTAKVDLIRFVKLTLVFTFVIEGLGTAGYYFVWHKYFSFSTALYYSFFHSISAFCTAGFGLFPDNMCSYNESVLINLNTFFLVITGAIGFFVLYDISSYLKKIYRRNYLPRLTFHSKVVLIFTFSLFFIGAVVILLSEGYKFSNNIFQNILDALFQSISASTTVGFNSVDISIMTAPSLFIMIILMFIGASPGSTGGGIKTTSFAAASIFSLKSLRGLKNINIFKRTIPASAINKSIVQIFIAALSTFIFTFIITITDDFDFLKILFEAVSAFGTVGLSTGITPNLSVGGKLSIIALMTIGRIGPLAIGFSLAGKNNNINYSYPEEDLFVS